MDNNIVNENIEENVENVEYGEFEEYLAREFQNILRASNGRDEDGNPRSSGSLSIIKADFLTKTEEELEAMSITEKDVKTLKEVIFTNTSVQSYVSGGCAVVELDIPVQSAFDYRNAKKILKEWFEEINNPEYDNQMLTFTLVPMVLHGQLTFSYQGLVYYFGVQAESGFKLIMCFDNNFTECYKNDDIDYEAITESVAEALRQEEDLLERQIYEVEQEIKSLKDANNIYEQNIKEQFSQDTFLDGLRKETEDDDNDEAENKHRGMRISKD